MKSTGHTPPDQRQPAKRHRQEADDHLSNWLRLKLCLLVQEPEIQVHQCNIRDSGSHIDDTLQ